MHLKLIFKKTINNKQMYSARLYKYRDSYALYKPTVHTFGTVSLHTLFWYRHTHDVSAH